jgi:polyferredoxin
MTQFGFKVESQVAFEGDSQAPTCRNPRLTSASVADSSIGEATGYQRTKARKIPIELRRPEAKYSAEPNPLKRFLWRLTEDSQLLRQTVQLAFVLLCSWIGYEFYLFMQWGMSGDQAKFFPRPPGAEGFLPISALISLKYWLHTGIINEIHPSGLFIFIAIVAVSFVVKKAFCSWLCPVGTLSEALWMLGKKLFGDNVNLPKWLDYPLRSLKYLLLLFFVWAIGRMDVSALKEFITSPYNKVADVKMYLFFARLSTFGLWTIIILMLLSVVVKNFWCRFLCPYGALLGITSFLSPLKITRTKETCVDCELCTKACPSNIRVHKAGRVWSDECMGCLACVEACPVKNTLEMKRGWRARAYPTWVYGALVVGVFVAITGFTMLTGHWTNKISSEEYLHHFQRLDSYDHLR